MLMPKSRLIMLPIVFLFIVIISGFRYFSDIDYSGYYELFEDVPKINNFNYASISKLYGEPGYLFLNSLIKSVGLNFYVVTLLFSALSIGIKIFVATRFSKYSFQIITLYLCLYFIIVEFIELRWSLASSLILLSIYFFYSKKYYKFTLAIGIASVIHYFSLVFLFLPVVRFVTVRKVYLIFVLSFLLAIYYKFGDFSIFVEVDSEYYIVRRFLRYLNDPESSVGVFSFLKILLYIAIVGFLRIFSSDARDIKLEKVMILLMSLSLFVSYVPLLYFRSMVIAEFIALSYIFHNLMYHKSSVKIFTMSVLWILFSMWSFLDVKNNISASYIVEYNSWLSILW